MRASSGRPHFTVGLVVHPSRSVLDSIRLITRYAGRSGAAVIARWCDAERVGPDVVTVAPEEFADRVDVLISLGGDGTMLGAMRLVVGRGVPVLGVNHGNLGFLIEVGPQELEPALDRLAEGRYTLEPHSCLEAGDSRAFNDIVIAAEPLSSLTLDLEVNGLRHGYYRGDAMIACTPTGSTAYNYAAGGPVISPSAPAVALTPVAPMSGISRSVILGKDDHIVLRNPSGEVPLIFSVDGTSAGPLQPGAELSVRLRTEAVDVVRFDADTHSQRNRVKLSLLDLPLRRDQLVELIPQPLRDQAERLRRG
ncbi:NAD(+)/NADH kinase [Nonomuraea sp. LP-02]|uniref:NAD(+)/NADH kinase n=1 Tax=Nonomuraea sp. LP-02 TaxID=3097960 RepID=UPI002E31DF2E|nr:NAD(+)/NADH kinase [Nonomuraea sp. LP-02]MED7931830.1 NAD(+)/NADH kinase [Nonomuraea sp. LP-02]